MKKVNRILLIDDDEPTNFIHQMVINDAECCEELLTADSGIEALDYIKTADHSHPDIIFLDINMPKMNGWQFLKEYKSVAKENKAKIIVMLLTTSLNPTDREMASQIEEVSGFRNKPITPEMLQEIIEEHF